MQLLHWLPRFQQASSALDALKHRESWARADIEALQLDRLNVLWRRATAHVPYYKRLRDRCGLPPSFQDLEEYRTLMPLLSKENVRRDQRDLLSSERLPGNWRWTSGSTAKPMKFYWSHADHREMLRCRYRFYADWGVDIFDRVAFVWGTAQGRNPSGILAQGKQWMFDRARNRLRLPAYHLGRQELRLMLRKIIRFRPAMIYGLSHAVHLLALEAREMGVTCNGLVTVVLTGEVVSPAALADVSEVFGVPAVVEYGATECLLIAGQAADGTLRVREDAVFIETLPRADHKFEIVLTVLTNRSFPLLRYQIEDVTDRSLHHPARGFAVLSHIAGRAGDVIRSSNGDTIHSARLDLIFESATFGKCVRRYRVHQSADGSLDVSVELATAAAALDVHRLGQSFQELVGDYAVRPHVVDQLDAASGKHRSVTSDLTDAHVVPR